MQSLHRQRNAIFDVPDGMSPLEFYVKHQLTQSQLASLLGIVESTAFEILHNPRKQKLSYRLACAHLDRLIETGELKLMRGDR